MNSMYRGLSSWQGKVESYNIHHGEQVWEWGREAGEKLEKRIGIMLAKTYALNKGIWILLCRADAVGHGKRGQKILPSQDAEPLPKITTRKTRTVLLRAGIWG